jgi:hypothetical protein
MASPDQHIVDEALLFRDGAKRPFTIRAASHLDFEAYDRRWKPLLQSRKDLDAEWNWSSDFAKVEVSSPDYETYALVSSEQRLEGLMTMIYERNGVYVERLAIAPWNRPPSREVRGVGAALMFVAIDRSVSRGLKGQVSLHSLEDPSTIAFYRDKMKMIEERTDPVEGQKLRYFVLSPETASTLRGGAS